jgi:predicted O-linked N-acetylglucosamine transferase (SPINDLY family)
MTLDQALQIALTHHQAGRLAEAGALYRQILARAPDHPDALHLLGVLACQSGHPDEAAGLIGRAIAVRPSVAEYHCNLGEALRRAGNLEAAAAGFRRAIELGPNLAGAYNGLGIVLKSVGRLDEAAAACRRAIELSPQYAEAHSNLGGVLRDQGRLDEAIAASSRAIGLRPDLAEAHANLGIALRESNRPAEAIAALRQAIALRPGMADAHNNLGDALRQTGRSDEAVATFQRALEIQPDDPVVHNNLAIALKDLGRLGEAAAACRRAIALAPGLVEAHSNLGTILRDQGRFDEAIAAFEQAIALKPSYAEAHSNLGISLKERGRLDEAIAAYHRAIALNPNLPEAYNNLGNALKDRGELDQAIAAYEQAIAIRAGYAEALNNLGNVYREQGRVDRALAAFRAALEARPGFELAASNLLFTVHWDPAYDGPALLAEHRRWASRHSAPLAAQIGPHANDRTPDRRLRIGLVSPDFRDHPAGQLVMPYFLHHDRRQAELVAYSDVRAGDAVTRQFMASSGEWHSLVGLSDAQAADQIRADRIDILIDLALHTAGNRALVFARKPAPIQVSMLGMPATTGLDTVDYRLTDAFFDPPAASDDHYTEQSVRLPRTIWCHWLPEEAPPPGPLPSLTKGFVTFGCLNQLAKVSQPALELWIRILQALPGARLVLQAVEGSHLDALRARFAAGGIAGDRVDFLPKVGRTEYMKRYFALDVSLDPFPYNGHTSSLDSLWMGVPLVTLAGRTGVGRAGVSVLSNVGLPELIAPAPDDYVQIAVELARDLDRLAALRASLRPRMQASPLADGPQYAADIDAALRWMWKTWCAR